MKVNVFVPVHFIRTPDHKIWTDTIFDIDFWQRYLDVFEHVNIVARIRDVLSVSSNYSESSGGRITFQALPDFVGPKQYLLQARNVHRTIEKVIKSAAENSEAIILRSAGGQIVSVAANYLHRLQYPYGLEVIADPQDLYAASTIKHPFSPFFCWQTVKRLKEQCRHSTAVSYVTENALQKRYPPGARSYTTHYSGVQLSDGSFVDRPRKDCAISSLKKLIMVGSLNNYRKSPDILIDAFDRCMKQGLELNLTIVGEGKYQEVLESKVAKLQLDQRVNFVGGLPAGKAVLDQLDKADLFVLPSRQEGLPNALLEAMARALPCIGSTVGGIPELLQLEDLVPPQNAIALANKIEEVITDSGRMARMSARNLSKVQNYRREAQCQRRISFYSHVRTYTRNIATL